MSRTVGQNFVRWTGTVYAFGDPDADMPPAYKHAVIKQIRILGQAGTVMLRRGGTPATVATFVSINGVNSIMDFTGHGQIMDNFGVDIDNITDVVEVEFA